jgi:glycosyltransferase involved in cell wall biosynthesis
MCGLEFVPMESPSVSCIMPTYNRRAFVPQAIKYFLRQDYPHKELIILDDGTDKIYDLVPDLPEIKYVALSQKQTVGEKRNMAIEASRGDIILHWDDDDWMHPCRISYQVGNMLRTKTDVAGISKVLFYDLYTSRLWLYEYSNRQRVWLCGGSLCYQRTLWAKKKFAPLNDGEDSKFIRTQPIGKILALPDPKFYLAMIHPYNTSRKSLSGPRWHQWQGETAQTLMKGDWDFYVGLLGKIEKASPK